MSYLVRCWILYFEENDKKISQSTTILIAFKKLPSKKSLTNEKSSINEKSLKKWSKYLLLRVNMTENSVMTLIKNKSTFIQINTSEWEC